MKPSLISKKSSRLIIAALIAPGALPAYAQVESSDKGSLRIEEILVTARRREESALVVPVTINAFSSEDIDRRQIRTSDDLAAQTPGMVVLEGPGTRTNNYVLRGVTPTFQGEAGVVAYMAEVPMSQHGNGPLLDLESIQVLKGPQGTLFGKNSVGGAVLFTPKKPSTEEMEGFVNVRLGNFDARELKGAINTPISDSLAIRFAGQYTKRDAMVENVAGPDIDTQDRLSGRMSVLFKPTDTFENTLILDGYTADEYLNNMNILSAVDPCSPANFVACAYQFFTPFSHADALAEQQALGIDKVAQPDAGKYGLDIWGITNTSTYEVGGVTLKNIFGYRDIDRSGASDIDGFRIPLVAQLKQPTEITELSEEFQIRGLNFDNKLNWVIGAFYSEETRDTIDQNTAILVPLAPSPLIVDDELTAQSVALFSQFTYDLDAMVEGLKFTAGFRYSWDERDFKGATFTPNRDIANCNNKDDNGDFLPGTDPETCIRKLDMDHEEYSYNINLEYSLSETTFLYATTRRGYKAGNFNPGAAGTGLISYDPELLTDYEIGIKSEGEAIGVPYRISIAAYTGDYTELQLQSTVFDNGNLTALVTNVGDASVDGFDLQASIFPLEGLEITGYYSYVDGKYDNSDDPTDFSGKALREVPDTTAGLGVNYSYPLSGDAGILAMNVFWNYTAEMPVEYGGQDSMFETVDSYSLVNAAIGLQSIAGSNVDIRMYVNNVFDKRTPTGALDVRDSLDFAAWQNYTPERTFGVELNYQF